MANTRASIEDIQLVNERSTFNRSCGFKIVSACNGYAELAMDWRTDLAQSAGFLHAGLIAGLIDTGCGYAAATVVGPVMASHISVTCLRPGIGERFIARAKVLKSGRNQIFTVCELYAVSSGSEKLIATGETLFVPVPTQLPG